jgi:chromosomal replication initiator protein
VEDIQKEVENFYKVRHTDLVGKSRLKTAVYPRQVAIYLCRELLDIPYNDIAKKFNRDHATAMHAVNKVEELKTTSRDLREEIEALKKIIKEL